MRKRFAQFGCLLTLGCWLLAIPLAIGTMMGDCFPTKGQACPTDHQRDMDLLGIVLTAAFVNIVGLFALGIRFTRGGNQN